MNYALIKNGVCENVIEANQDFIEKILPEWEEIILADGTRAEKGATWDGTVFIRKETPISVMPPVDDPFVAINAKLDKVITDLAVITNQTKPKV